MYFVKFPDALRGKWRIFLTTDCADIMDPDRSGEGSKQKITKETKILIYLPFQKPWLASFPSVKTTPFVNRPLIRVIPVIRGAVLVGRRPAFAKATAW